MGGKTQNLVAHFNFNFSVADTLSKVKAKPEQTLKFKANNQRFLINMRQYKGTSIH